MNQELYFLRSTEQYLAKELLYYAAHLNKSDKTLGDFPELNQYEEHFGSYDGDIGVYILADAKVAGAAWVRILPNGKAYINNTTPELTLSIKPDFKGKGIDTALLIQLFAETSKLYSQMSVSVRDIPSVIKFYEELDFIKCENTEHKNALGVASFIMLKKLEKPNEEKEIKHLEEACFRRSYS
jgi:ribosomal protein S18 acetylase RimI-like enzyme